MEKTKAASSLIVGALGTGISMTDLKDAVQLGVLAITFISGLTLYIWGWCDRAKKNRGLARLECEKCKKTSGPYYPMDDEHPGYICKRCR